MSAVDHERINKIEIAISFNARNIEPALFQMLGYRQRLAEEIMRLPTDEGDELFDHVNNQIKELLGI